jgi:hypothetical protein
MPGQRGSEVRRFTDAVTIRMSDELAIRCASAARAANLSTPAWLRRAVAEMVGMEEGEEPRRSAPRTPIRRPPSELVRVLVTFADLLADLAEKLVQISAVQDSEGDAAGHSDLQRLLVETRAASAAVVVAIETVSRP